MLLRDWFQGVSSMILGVPKASKLFKILSCLEVLLSAVVVVVVVAAAAAAAAAAASVAVVSMRAQDDLAFSSNISC